MGLDIYSLNWTRYIACTRDTTEGNCSKSVVKKDSPQRVSLQIFYLFIFEQFRVISWPFIDNYETEMADV